MKCFTSLFLLPSLLLLMASFYCESAITGRLSTFKPHASGLRNGVKPYFIDNATYVNGGVVFSYPEGLFSTTPTIRVSLEENATAYSPSQVFVAHITASSATSVTIRVNLVATSTIASLVTTSTITEASNDEVTVHIFAVEM